MGLVVADGGAGCLVLSQQPSPAGRASFDRALLRSLRRVENTLASARSHGILNSNAQHRMPEYGWLDIGFFGNGHCLFSSPKDYAAQ